MPVGLDADGLNAFEGKASELTHRKAATVLTPHPGEAARLLGVTTPEINADRVASARRLAAQSGAVVLLKGAASVVAAPSGRVLVNATGGPELATGGTGDVLTGLVAALLAQGCAPLLAAALAAWLHGAAGDALAAEGRSSGLLATDLADAIPSLCAQLRREVEDGSAAPDIAIGTLLPFP